jgi:MRG-binding protein
MNLIWTPQMEINLFYAMIDHKPIGENKHFHMIFIYEKFNNLNEEKKLSIDQIWQHLNELYDMQALEENEILAFPTDENEEFCLPDFEHNNANNVSDDSEASLKTINSTSTKNDKSDAKGSNVSSKSKVKK